MMRDLKSPKRSKVKGNRRKKEKTPIDWKKFFHRFLRVSVVLGSAALLISGGVLTGRMLFESDYFRVDAIRVENQHRVDRDEILALSDIRMGTSIFDLDLEMIGRKIEENPWIAAARVDRVFPREVVIRVAERVPRAVTNLGYLYYIDSSGEVFKTLGPEDSLDFPVVTGVDRKFMLENPRKARGMLLDAMALLDEVAGRSRFTLEDVSEVHIDPVEGLEIFTYVGGVPIRMGFGNYDTKLDRLERIYGDLEPRLSTLKYIDLNVLDRVIVKIDPKRTTGHG